MIDNERRRVVITGLGVVAPNGIGTEAFWHATSRGISGIKALPTNELTTADSMRWTVGAISNFIAEDYIDRKLINRSDRMTHFAFAAMQEAIADAELRIEQENPRRVGAVIANTLGGAEYVLRQLAALYTRGPRFVSAYTAIAWLNVSNVGQAAIRYGIQGYCKTPVNDAAGGLDALGMAYNAIRRGSADIILAGGCEAFLQPIFLQVLAQQGICISGNDPHAYRPFDRRANGLLMAEGAGICILETYEHARQRGARIYGEIVGYGQTNDAYGLATPSADGVQYARALRLALTEANILPTDIAYLSLDGRAVPSFDMSEARALQETFGEDLPCIPASVPRTMSGHSYAAAGAIDAITALLALQHEIIPPTINCEEPDPRYGLDIVQGVARPLPIVAKISKTPAVLIGGRGFGGTNVALALKKVV